MCLQRMAQPRPFHVHVEDAVLNDLKERLDRTRIIPPGFNQKGMHYGQERETQEELLRYWKEDYDWRKYEKEINSFDNFMCDIEGLDLHFIHQKSSAPKAIPLLIVHGWPGSVWEFHRAMPKLVASDENGRAFHVIAPSIPGYGWSQAANEAGMGIVRVAKIFNELMKRLGYNQYVAQGGDWGALITKEIALRYPTNCVMLHQNMPIPSLYNLGLIMRGALDMSPIGRLTLSDRDVQRLQNLKEYMKSGNAYMILQASKPHTLGDALADSPAGLLSWICEKLDLWAEKPNGNLFEGISKDDILTNVMIYWVTNSITSSMRFYFETIPLGKRGSDKVQDFHPGYVSVPTGIAFFPKEAIAFPLGWIRQGFNVVHWTEHDKGGHFAAWEQPEAFARDVRSFALDKVSFTDACKHSPHGGVGWLPIAAGAAIAVGYYVNSRL